MPPKKGAVPRAKHQAFLSGCRNANLNLPRLTRELPETPVGDLQSLQGQQDGQMCRPSIQPGNIDTDTGRPKKNEIDTDFLVLELLYDISMTNETMSPKPLMFIRRLSSAVQDVVCGGTDDIAGDQVDASNRRCIQVTWCTRMVTKQ